MFIALLRETVAAAALASGSVPSHFLSGHHFLIARGPLVPGQTQRVTIGPEVHEEMHKEETRLLSKCLAVHGDYPVLIWS
jgi:hypothetical protein